LYFPAAFDAEGNAKIEMRYPKERRIRVGETDALRFACNAINVGGLILLNQISSELAGRLEMCGFHVEQVQLTEFLKAGGAAKCLVLRLSEMDATHAERESVRAA
jgi:ornithine--oxo-acid transaminase